MKSITKILIISALVGNVLTMCLTFFIAFFNNNQVTISINNYHEAWFEAVLIPMIFVLGVFLIYSELKEFKNEK